MRRALSQVTREDVAVVLYEERREVGAGGGGASCVVWEESATVVMVHKQAAIAFTTPPYREPRTSQHVDVSVDACFVTLRFYWDDSARAMLPAY